MQKPTAPWVRAMKRLLVAAAVFFTLMLLTSPLVDVLFPWSVSREVLQQDFPGQLSVCLAWAHSYQRTDNEVEASRQRHYLLMPAVLKNPGILSIREYSMNGEKEIRVSYSLLGLFAVSAFYAVALFRNIQVRVSVGEGPIGTCVERLSRMNGPCLGGFQAPYGHKGIAEYPRACWYWVFWIPACAGITGSESVAIAAAARACAQSEEHCDMMTRSNTTLSFLRRQESRNHRTHRASVRSLPQRTCAKLWRIPPLPP